MKYAFREPRTNPFIGKNPAIKMAIATFLSFSMLLMSAASSLAQSSSRKTADPTQDKYSQAVREAFSKCRAETSPMTQFFCTCRVLESQCEAPRRLEHGDWNTVEYWPSNNEADREVQFVLFVDYDILGEFAPLDTGLVLTCMGGVFDFNVFLGDNVYFETAPIAMIGNVKIDSEYDVETGSLMLKFKSGRDGFDVISNNDNLYISYIDLEDKEHSFEFDVYGFDEVSKGWETLCFSSES